MATAETNFALTFLQQLSARQQKYAADFVAPPSTLGPKPLIVASPTFQTDFIAPSTNGTSQTQTHCSQR